MNKAIVLTDGEHYPAVTHDAIEVLRAEYDILAAVFIGGTEKIGSDADLARLGVPVVRYADCLVNIPRASKCLLQPRRLPKGLRQGRHGSSGRLGHRYR